MRIENLQQAIEAEDPQRLLGALEPFYQELPDAAVPLLCKLIQEDWHAEHQELAMLLQRSGNSQAVSALKVAAQMPFEFLVKNSYLNLSAFRRKCIGALASIGTEESKQALSELSISSSSELAAQAKKELNPGRRSGREAEEQR